MVTVTLYLLLNIAITIGLFYLVIFVVEQLGFTFPEQLKRVGYVIVLLVILILIWRAFGYSMVAP